MRKFCLFGLVAVTVGIAAPAHAYEFSGPLKAGASGPDIVALQIRLAGWFPRSDKTPFKVDGLFGRSTKTALMAFERHFGLSVDGIADNDVYKKIHALEDGDGTTLHFDWEEFEQRSNSGCPRRANLYAGSFAGGPLSQTAVKRNVRLMMWRLEALRAKVGDKPIAITSGFRGTAYNRCIGGATASQHLYGTAADIRVVGVDNRRARDLARASQFSGIGCYSNLSHNHLDLRLENDALKTSQSWWWPTRDEKGRDLSYDGRPCWGEVRDEARKQKGNETKVLTITASDARQLEELPEEFLSGND
jgi:zinc D-Ala-D-Ala carboxypeptidase